MSGLGMSAIQAGYLAELQRSSLEHFVVYSYITGNICFSCRKKKETIVTPTGAPVFL